MALDETLVNRVRSVLRWQKGITERKMFGGLSFLLNGNMCCGVVKELLVLRLGEQGAAEALAEPHASPMDFTGTPMKSMVYVAPGGTKSAEALREWVRRAVSYASSLPAKGGEKVGPAPLPRPLVPNPSVRSRDSERAPACSTPSATPLSRPRHPK